MNQRADFKEKRVKQEPTLAHSTYHRGGKKTERKTHNNNDGIDAADFGWKWVAKMSCVRVFTDDLFLSRREGGGEGHVSRVDRGCPLRIYTVYIFFAWAGAAR
jgi:hypothetical protein